MNKILLSAGLSLIAATSMYALPVNNALVFEEGGTVNCGAIPELNGLKSYTIQFWLCPDSWDEGAVVMHRGDNFKVTLGSDKSVTFTNGSNSVKATGLKDGEWNQFTLICKDGKATILVNGTANGSDTLGELENTKRAFIMGGNYKGWLDEVRLWNAAFTDNEEMARFDNFTNNTINKFNPMWDNLIAYYKMDQTNCPLVVEYKVMEKPKADGTDNHGVMSLSGVKKMVAGNDKMPYLVSAAYTENARFYDRLIPRDAYLLSNEIIILGADCVAEDGSVKLKTPNNHGTKHGGVSYVESKGVRNGVVFLDGKAGSYIEAPAESVHKYKVDNLNATPYSNTDLSTYTFMTRIFINEWQPGAVIFSKENEDHTKGICIYMGETEKTLVARVNGKTNLSKVMVNLKLNQWSHIAIVSSTSTAKINKIQFIGHGETYTGAANECNIEDVSLLDVADIPIKIGEGFNGWIDETYISGYTFGAGMIQTYINTGVPVPSVEQGQAVERMNAAGCLYNYDDKEDLGYSSISQDNILRQIKKQYEGYTQPRVILSVRGHSDNSYEDAFLKISWDAKKTANFAQQLVELGKDYDGIEFDFEWADKADQIQNFAKLPEAVKDVLPEGMLFRISIHNSYYNFAKAWANDEKLAGFTIQQYGPNVNPYYYTSFLNGLSDIENAGYPKNKLMTSFSTTMTNSKSVKDGALANWEYKDENYSTYNKETFMTPLQVYRRAKYTRENGYMGIFYWDMGNDYWKGSHESNGMNIYDGMPEFNQTRWANYALSANIDKQKTDILFNHPDTEVVEGEKLALPVYISESAISLHATATSQLKASVLGLGETDKVTWTSADPSVATVENGLVTAVKPGKAVISATYETQSADCEVTVETTYATSVVISPATLTLKAGETSSLSATVAPAYTTDKTIVWTSDNAAVATVDNGTVTAVAPGTAKITATCGTVSAVCSVTVEAVNQDGGEVDDPNQGGSGEVDDPNQGGSGEVDDPNQGGGGEVDDPNQGGGGEVDDPNQGGGGDVNDPNQGGGGEVDDPNQGGGGEVDDPNQGGGGEVDDPNNGVEGIEYNKADAVVVYPTLAESYVNVTLSNGETPSEVVIYSLNGGMMKHARNESRINVSNLSSAMYIVIARDSKGNVYNGRFIKK